MHPELLLLYFRPTHMVSVVPTSIAVAGPASYTVSPVNTNVGALAVFIHASITSIQLSSASSAVFVFVSVTVSVIVANKTSSCYLCSCNSSSSSASQSWIGRCLEADIFSQGFYNATRENCRVMIPALV
jgi:hypothetical protein